MLLINWKAQLIFDLSFDISNRVFWVHLEVKCPTTALLRFDEDLHTLSEFEDQGRSILDIVMSEWTLIIEPLSIKEKILLIKRNTKFDLDFCLNSHDYVRFLYSEVNSFPRVSFDENLHSFSLLMFESKGIPIFDCIIFQSSSILKLISSEIKLLLMMRNTFFSLNPSFDTINCVRLGNFKIKGFARTCFDKNLHFLNCFKDECGLMPNLVTS